MAEDRPLPAKRDATLDRRAVERVLARAAELQATAASDSSEQISEQQLVEIAREAGLDVASVRRALAEERARLDKPAETGTLSRAFGPRSATASRLITGDAATLLAALDRWMQRDECLRLQRRFPDGIIWEPRSDFAGTIKQAFGGKRYELAKSRRVSATLVPVDERQTLVSLEVDLGARRRERLGAGAFFAGAGLTAGAVFASLVVPAAAIVVALIPTAIGSTIGWAIARSHREAVERAQLALEQALDRLEYGDARAARSLVDAIGAVARPLLR